MFSNFFSEARIKQIQSAIEREINQLLENPKAYRASLKKIYCQLGKYLMPPAKRRESVLELGCGPGKYVALLSALGFDVTAIDLFRFPTWDRIQHKFPVKFMDQVSAERLPFQDQSFDHAVCLGALLYFDQPEDALAEVRRVLKPGGKLIIRTVNGKNLYTKRTGNKIDPFSKQLYLMDELLELLKKNGFVVSDFFSYGFFPPFAPNFWWYLQMVFLPHVIQEFLSELTPPEYRVNLTVFARSYAI